VTYAKRARNSSRATRWRFSSSFYSWSGREDWYSRSDLARNTSTVSCMSVLQVTKKRDRRHRATATWHSLSKNVLAGPCGQAGGIV
jgi:hypothetical protein